MVDKRCGTHKRGGPLYSDIRTQQVYQLLKTDICQQLIARSFNRFYLGQVNYVVLRCSFRLKDKIKFSSHFDPKDTSLSEASCDRLRSLATPC